MIIVHPSFSRDSGVTIDYGYRHFRDYRDSSYSRAVGPDRVGGPTQTR